MSIDETAPTASESGWFKSSYSSGEGGQCVEVKVQPRTVHVRDSKKVTGPALTVAPQAWMGFVGLAARQSD